jgi:predicted nucleotidyltransferase component of viral defense system
MTVDAQSNGRARSVLDRLLNIHREHGIEHQLLIDRYVQERFLYRLSQSSHRDGFVLKGGLLITAVTDRFYRSTRDIDLETRIALDSARFKQIIETITACPVEDDGVSFEETAEVVPIQAQREEPGLRALVRSRIGKARALVQVDIAYGDTIMLPVPRFEYPILLSGYPVPVLNAYSRETIIAEKLEAIARFDQLLSRYKDYDDVLEIAALGVAMPQLWMAIDLTFTNRATPLNRLMPALGHERVTAARERDYARYRQRDSVRGTVEPFGRRLERLRQFVGPIIAYGVDGRDRRWEGGQWKAI